MAMKTDFHDPFISLLGHHQLFMAMKKVFMSHEIISWKIVGFQWGHENWEMQYLWPWKKIHGFFISISWDFYEPAVGSDILFTANTNILILLYRELKTEGKSFCRRLPFAVNVKLNLSIISDNTERGSLKLTRCSCRKKSAWNGKFISKGMLKYKAKLTFELKCSSSYS